jgi:tRNA(fMet)-specific endonuclease VapC
MAYLLDTNTCIDLLRHPQPRVQQKLASLPNADVYLCSPVVGELYYGAYRSNNVTRNCDLIDELLQTMHSLPFDDAAAGVFGEIRSRLATAGTPIGPFDLQIAAIALVHDLTLVTHNTREFSRVSGLVLDDWLS